MRLVSLHFSYCFPELMGWKAKNPGSLLMLKSLLILCLLLYYHILFLSPVDHFIDRVASSNLRNCINLLMTMS
ncbi:hypothetical protein BDW62DRAFT_12904 [Aspergillus aurantiobrunneus]